MKQPSPGVICKNGQPFFVWVEKGIMATRLQLVASTLFLLCVAGLFSPMAIFAQTGNFPDTLTINTTATFVSTDFPSSVNNFFNVTFQQTNPTASGSFIFRDCTIGGVPADGAVNVGNCRWTEFVDDGFILRLFTFNWRDAGDVGTPAVFGQFCLLNEFGAGVFARFVTQDGTSAGVVGSASGPLTYQPPGFPPF